MNYISQQNTDFLDNRRENEKDLLISIKLVYAKILIEIDRSRFHRYLKVLLIW